MLFRDVINLARLISWNGNIREELVDSMAGVEEKAIGIETAARMKNLLANYLVDPQHVDSVCLFDTQFRSVCYGDARSIGGYYQDKRYKTIALTDWYKKSAEANGKVTFFGSNVLTDSPSSNTFSSVKLLKDPESLFEPKVIGLLVINIKKSMFTKVFNENDQDVVMVLDSSHYKIRVVNDLAQKNAMEELIGKDLASTIELFQKKEYLVTSYTNARTGWVFLHAIPESELLKQSNYIAVATTAIATVIGLISLFLSFIFSGRVTRPLRDLKSMMAEFGRGKSNPGYDFQQDEMGAIQHTFKEVATENQILSNKLISSQLKEREAELRSLQAQVKPHFLYNTLDSIYWMAVLNENQDIANMTIALSQSFKLSLNNGKDLIPVSQELEHIQHYMTIQNVRYNNRFAYIEEVDPKLKEKNILKLLLQPLVENAIYHGLEPKEGEGTIWVEGNLVDGQVIFIVKDDGVGIADMEATRRGYGLRNVMERIELFYGSQSSFKIHSSIGKGTSIEIKFHLLEEG
ncbi:MAG: cache domain-containing sensor histidine kinase [Bacillota bacterium]